MNRRIMWLLVPCGLMGWLLLVMGHVVRLVSAETTNSTITVNSLSDSPTAEPDFCTLRRALHNANSNSGEFPGCLNGSGLDTITFASGLTGTITLEQGELDILDNTIIIGPGRDHLAISGNHVTRIFSTTTNLDHVEISHLTLSQGNAGPSQNSGLFFSFSSATGCLEGCGAAINSLNETNLTVDSVLIYDNLAGHGGGIQIFNNDATITNTIFLSNQANYSGAALSTRTNQLIETNLHIFNSSFHLNTGLTFGPGAVWASGLNTIQIENSNFTENKSTDAASAVLLGHNGQVTIRDAIFSRNIVSGTSPNSNGALELFGSPTTIEGSAFVGNSAHRAGAIYHAYGSLTVTKSIISGNSATTYGGGIFSDDHLTVTQSAIFDNDSNIGGGISHAGGAMLLENVTLSNNEAQAIGGNLFHNSPTSLYLTNTTIVRGSAPQAANLWLGAGRAHAFATAIGDRQAPETENCAFGAVANWINRGGNMIDDDSCDREAGADTVNLMLAALAEVDTAWEAITFSHTPLPGSPLIDNTPCTSRSPTVDQRGFARPQGAGCDAGAVELDVVPTAVALRAFSQQSNAELLLILPLLLFCLTSSAWIGNSRRRHAD